MNRLLRVVCHDEPSNIASDLTRKAACEESKETWSLSGFHAESCKGKVKAMPGYDRT